MTATDSLILISPVEVPVGSARISAFRADDGRIWIGIRSVCASLGVDTTGQVRKLQKKPWASLRSDLRTVAADGKNRQMIAIDLECLPAWLSTIEPGRVSATLGDRLIELQRKAHTALREHFFGKTKPIAAAALDRPEPTPAVDVPARRPSLRDHLVCQAQAVLSQAQELSAHSGELVEIRGRLNAIESRQREAAGRLLLLPPSETPPPIPFRRYIEVTIAELADRTGVDHHETWRAAYRALRLHYGTDAYARARNATRRAGREIAKIDALEADGLLGQLYAVAREMLRQAEPTAVDGGLSIDSLYRREMRQRTKGEAASKPASAG